MMKITPYRHLLLGASLGVLAATTAPANAADDPHAHHHHQMATMQPGVNVSTVNYKIGAVALVKANGEKTDLAVELNDQRPVMLNFIFTTCTAICPVMTHTLAEVQRQLGADASRIHVMSISIDPENDTPSKLRDYARQFGTGENWDFYTGSAANSIAAQKTFAAYGGDKMNHEGLTLIRAAPGRPWLRLDGLADATQIVAEYRKMASTN